MTKHHKDPPPSAVPLDHSPTAGPIYKPRRAWKRALTAAACAAVIGLTYALIPIAFAVGGAAIGVWWAAATFYEWLDGHDVDEEPLRS